MPGKLIFCATKREALSLDCFILRSLTGVTEAVDRLNADETVAAVGSLASTGWRAPANTLVLMTSTFVRTYDAATVQQACVRALMPKDQSWQ